MILVTTTTTIDQLQRKKNSQVLKVVPAYRTEAKLCRCVHVIEILVISHTLLMRHSLCIILTGDYR